MSMWHNIYKYSLNCIWTKAIQKECHVVGSKEPTRIEQVFEFSLCMKNIQVYELTQEKY